VHLSTLQLEFFIHSVTLLALNPSVQVLINGYAGAFPDSGGTITKNCFAQWLQERQTSPHGDGGDGLANLAVGRHQSA